MSGLFLLSLFYACEKSNSSGNSNTDPTPFQKVDTVYVKTVSFNAREARFTGFVDIDPILPATIAVIQDDKNSATLYGIREMDKREGDSLIPIGGHDASKLIIVNIAQSPETPGRWNAVGTGSTKFRPPAEKVFIQTTRDYNSKGELVKVTLGASEFLTVNYNNAILIVQKPLILSNDNEKDVARVIAAFPGKDLHYSVKSLEDLGLKIVSKNEVPRAFGL